MRAEHDRLPMPRGLQHVVSAFRHERTSHEDNCRVLKHCGKFTDAVEQEDVAVHFQTRTADT